MEKWVQWWGISYSQQYSIQNCQLPGLLESLITFWYTKSPLSFSRPGQIAWYPAPVETAGTTTVLWSYELVRAWRSNLAMFTCLCDYCTWLEPQRIRIGLSIRAGPQKTEPCEANQAHREMHHFSSDTGSEEPPQDRSKSLRSEEVRGQIMIVQADTVSEFGQMWKNTDWLSRGPSSRIYPMFVNLKSIEKTARITLTAVYGESLAGCT